MGLFSLEKRRSREYLAAVIHHPLPHSVTEERERETTRERQALLTGPQGKEKRQWQVVTGEILVGHMEKIPSATVMQVWDRHQRGGEMSVLGDSPD